MNELKLIKPYRETKSECFWLFYCQEKQKGTKRTVKEVQDINYTTVMIKPTQKQTRTFDKILND
jgi:hypothetical protein